MVSNVKTRYLNGAPRKKEAISLAALLNAKNLVDEARSIKAARMALGALAKLVLV
jgi:hypothetical protein